MNNKQKVEKHFSIELIDAWADNCYHYIYEEATADGYTVFISTSNPNNIIVEENIFYYDSELSQALKNAIVVNKIPPNSKIYIGMLNDGECWIEEAMIDIVESLGL